MLTSDHVLERHFSTASGRNQATSWPKFASSLGWHRVGISCSREDCNFARTLGAGIDDGDQMLHQREWNRAVPERWSDAIHVLKHRAIGTDALVRGMAQPCA
jgi:hypothetical protein